MKITMPLAIYQERKTKKDKRIGLSVNTYRNAHYIVNNNAKKKYKELVKEQKIKDDISKAVANGKKIAIELHLWRDNNRSLDLGNRTFIQNKYASDAIVELGYIPDDNTDYIVDIHCKYKGIDAGNGRCEITFSAIDDPNV